MGPEHPFVPARKTPPAVLIQMTTQPQTVPNPAQPKRSLQGARLRKHADYQKAYAAASRKRQSASMSWFLAPRTSENGEQTGARVGLTAGKVLGKAHERNRIKRRMREALRRHVELLPASADLILHPRRTVLTIDFAKLEAEIVRILLQAQEELTRKGTSTQTDLKPGLKQP
jgi:ribonuclease P protein component